MTRVEAIDLLRAKTAVRQNGGMDVMHTKQLERWIDAFVALGMLKLEDPLTPDQKRESALANDLNSRLTNPFDPRYLGYALESCGLKLVDK